MKTHPIIADLQARKTSKRYDPTKRVPPQDMEVLYESLRLSASSINAQPWKFIVLESKQAKDRLANTFSRMFQYNRRQVLDASHVILLAHNPRYTLQDYTRVVDTDIANGRTEAATKDRALEKFSFAKLNTDEHGSTANWTKAQVYIALGNALHTLARLQVDATPMEGIDVELISKAFQQELNGYVCHVALAVGYHHRDDHNAALPKSRLAREEVLQIL